MVRVGYTFADRELLRHALTHRSWVAENTGRTSNERLEFLGDAVLGAVVAETIFGTYSDLPEGELAKIRAEVVSGASLGEIATEVGLGDGLYLGKGERLTGGAEKPSILADALEALIGAVFVEAGWDRARELILGLVGSKISNAAVAPGLEDHKTTLQELLTRRVGMPPTYEVTEEGPDHAKRFIAVVSSDGSIIGTGDGTSKKEAEQQAAKQALGRLGAATDANTTDANN